MSARWLLLLALLGAGCVTKTAGNFLPQDDRVEEIHRMCSEGASGAALCLCMATYGYRLREPNAAEVTIGAAATVVWNAAAIVTMSPGAADFTMFLGDGCESK